MAVSSEFEELHWPLVHKHKFYSRKQIRVSTITVHENFTHSVNDIALLRLGKKVFADPFNNEPIHRGEGESYSLQPCLSS